jgi:hypothetical protein
MVRSAHIGHDGEVYAYVDCDAGHVHRVGAEAFQELRGGRMVIDTRCQSLGRAGAHVSAAATRCGRAALAPTLRSLIAKPTP